MNQSIRRLGIYSVYDANGIIDEYVFCFLQEFCKYINKLYIVCNESVQERDRARLSQYAEKVYIYPDDTQLLEAYHIALESVGYEQLDTFDELALVNSDLYGPLFPLSEMFEAMEQEVFDFWGITSQREPDFSKHGQNSLLAYLHLQFIVVRKRMLSDQIFEAYWFNNVCHMETKEIRRQAVQFTQYFQRKGFSWGTYTGTEKRDGVFPQLCVMDPVMLVRDRRCPAISRDYFSLNYTELLTYTNGTAGRELIAYIYHYLDYNVELIWENLLRTCNHAVLRRVLHLNYILPDHTGKTVDRPDVRIALWMHIFYEDLVPECVRYAAAMPNGADIIVTTDTGQKKDQIEKMFSSLNFGKLKVVLVKNRGRDNSALLVGCAPFLCDYDIVCFAHDKKVGHLLEIQGRAFSEHCYQNALRSKEFVQNVVQTFLDNPRLGVLCPPPPNTSAYYNTVGISDWGPNYENTKALYNRLALQVPISREIEPVAPFGSIFWFRTCALEQLFQYGWTYDDFPEEPVSFDGTLLHAIERIYPFVAQQAGFYSGWLLSESFAAVELTNYHYMLRQLNLRLHPICSARDFKELCGRTEKLLLPSWRIVYQPLKRWLKAHLSESAYYSIVKLKERIFRKR